MKIEIDTSRDSKEEIKKLIKMLQAIIEEGSGWGTAQAYNTSEMPGLGFMDAPAGSSTAEKKKDDDDEIPQVELY